MDVKQAVTTIIVLQDKATPLEGCWQHYYFRSSSHMLILVIVEMMNEVPHCIDYQPLPCKDGMIKTH